MIHIDRLFYFVEKKEETNEPHARTDTYVRENDDDDDDERNQT